MSNGDGVGGVTKGDSFGLSGVICLTGLAGSGGLTGSAGLTGSGLCVGFAGIFGLSLRFIGGGSLPRGLGGCDGSLRNSPDRLGGGGSGGRLCVVGANSGDFSNDGVVGLLGILNVLPVELPCAALSPCRKSDGFGAVILRLLLFAGELGGSMWTDGERLSEF